MSKLIVEIETEMNGIPDCCGLCDPLFTVVCATRHDQTIDKMMLRVGRPTWCPIKGVLPDEHGDLIDRHKTAEELNEMADAVYNDFPLVDRETLASWDHGIRIAAQYVQNLAGRKDATERTDDDK